MKLDDRQVLYQKKGVTISNVASSLLSRNAGDRIPPISYYQEEYGVSRGTIQNAFRYLKEAGAVELAVPRTSGHLHREDRLCEASGLYPGSESCLELCRFPTPGPTKALPPPFMNS